MKWALKGNACNSGDPVDVWLPPQSFLPVDASRWQEPLTDDELVLCGEPGDFNKIECITCFYCEDEILYGEDETMPSPSCEEKTFRAYYINPFNRNEIIHNQCRWRPLVLVAMFCIYNMSEWLPGGSGGNTRSDQWPVLFWGTIDSQRWAGMGSRHCKIN